VLDFRTRSSSCARAGFVTTDLFFLLPDGHVCICRLGEVGSVRAVCVTDYEQAAHCTSGCDLLMDCEAAYSALTSAEVRSIFQLTMLQMQLQGTQELCQMLLSE